jgi:AcrR family transcriptional regulator
MGLRELKKERTRLLIADTAWRLFVDHGFDEVSVAQVAREAEVSEATVFNYFHTKEDLFFSRMGAFETRMLDTVRTRPAGEPVLAAFRRIFRPGGLLAQVASGDQEALVRLRTLHRIVAGSPKLLAHERQAIDRATDGLAAMLLAEAGPPHDPVAARVAANALVGVHRALIDYLRERVLSGARPERLAADVRQQASRAFTLLENGLGDYAPR